MITVPSHAPSSQAFNQLDGENSPTVQRSADVPLHISLEEGVSRLAPSIDEIGRTVLSLSHETDDATLGAVLTKAAKKMQEFAAWVPHIEPPPSHGKESIPQLANLALRTQNVILVVRGVQEKVLGLSRALEKTRPDTPVLSLMKDIDIPLNQFCAFFEHICPINPEKLPLQSDIELFDAALARSRTVPPEEAKQIEDLLRSAVGNRDLNHYLGQKEREAQAAEKPKELTLAELCLREVTYTTMKAPSASVQIQKLEDFLREIRAVDFSASVVSYRRQERSVRDQVSVLLTEKDAPWASRVKDIFSQMERIRALLEPMQSSQLSTQQLQRRRVGLLEELQGALRQIAGLHEMPRRCASRIRDIVKEVGTAITHLQQLLDTMDDHEKKLQSGQWIPTLTLRDFWVLRRYKEIAPILEKLRSRGIILQDEKLKRLEEEGARAMTCMEQYDRFFHALPNYMTGDVVVDDDRRERELEGKVPVETFEDAKRLFDLAMEKTHDLNAAIWPLRALATQGLSHIAYAFMRRGTPTVLEIIGECETNRIDPEMAMISASLRLNLLGLLTEEGREALSAHFRGDSDEQLERRLLAIYQESQKQYFDENKSRFATLDNRDPLHAVQAFLSRSVEELPKNTVLGRVYRYALEKFSGQAIPEEMANSQQSIQAGIEEMGAEAAQDPKKDTKRLCSELVAEVVRDIHGIMEQRLQQELGVQTLVFRPIIPADRKLGSYTIDVLVEELKRSGGYSQVPDSLAVRLCVQLPEPAKILHIPAASPSGPPSTL